MPSTWLLAFGFEAPWILAGLVAGGIPVLIHLLYRRRYRPTPWAAMQFLIEAARKNSQFLQIQQLLLLLIRVMILVFVVLGLAQPYLATLMAPTARIPNKFRVILIDSSLSMGHRANDQTRLERAQKMVREIGDQMQTGDVTHLLAMPPKNRTATESGPSSQPIRDRSHLLERLELLQLTEQVGNATSALQDVSQLLQDEEKIAAREVVILSDFQKTLWQPAQPAVQMQLRKLMKQIAGAARVTLLDVSGQSFENSTIAGIRLPETFLSTAETIPIDVTLRHFGTEPQTGKKLELFVDQRPVGSQIVDLTPGVTTSATFELELSQAGNHRAEIRLEEDALPVDNHYWFDVKARENLNVLIVNGQPSADYADDAATFLSTALSPSTARQAWQGFTQTTTIRDSELPQQELRDYACVILSNVALLTQREAENLMAYTAGGGGVILFMGDRVQSDNYNQLFYNIEQPWLPAHLDGPVVSDATPTAGHLFEPRSYVHPLLSDFRGNTSGGLSSAITWNYLKTSFPEATQSAGEATEIALDFSSGDPVVLEKRFQKGNVFLVTTAANLQWGTWPLQSSFPPLIHQLVRLAAAGGNSEQTLRVGQPYSTAAPSRVFDVEATISTPQNEKKRASVLEQTGRVQLTFDETDHSGWYQLDFGPPVDRSEFFAVNTDIAESDLSATTTEEMRNDVFPDTLFSFRQDWNPTISTELTTSPAPNHLVAWLLLAALGLLFVEQLMAWEFIPGLILLAALITIVVVVQAWSSASLTGTLLAVVVLAGLAGATWYIHRCLERN